MLANHESTPIPKNERGSVELVGTFRRPADPAPGEKGRIDGIGMVREDRPFSLAADFFK